MRITNNMMVNTLMGNLTRNMNRMSVYQDKLATGKEVLRASDDPVATSGILKFKSDIAALGQYEKNSGDSLAWMEVTESSISDTGAVLQRMRELAVQAANGTNSTEDTKKIASEIEQMRKHLISNGNFSFAGRYAFSGYQTDVPLFNDDGTYRIDITQGDIDNKAKLQYQVSIAQEMEVTTSGLDVFGVRIPAVPTALQSNLPNGADAYSAGLLSGPFPLNIDYTGDNLNITINGVAYNVDESTMDGSVTPLTQADVLNHFNNAANGSAKLSDVANVYFDSVGNLAIKAKMSGPVQMSEVSVNYTPTFTNSAASAKSTLTGAFQLDANHSAENLDITVNGVVFDVIEANLVGSVAAPLTKDAVLSQFNGAMNGPTKLSDVADVFYNASGELVIKAKTYGPIAVSGGSATFTTTAVSGNGTVEATIIGAASVTDATVAANQAALKSGAFYLTVGDERKRIQVDSAAPITTVAQWVTAMQNAVDTAFGTGTVTVSGSTGNPISFTTVGTPNGILPEIKLENIVTRESSLISDIDTFITALNTGNQAGMGTFLGQIDDHLNRVLSVRADIGGRVNRMELIANRISDNTISFTKMLSDVQDADMAGVIMYLKNAENVYKAALSTGSKVIQPSLIDFLR